MAADLPPIEHYVRKEYPLSDVTARIIAAAQEVHRTIGPGFEEIVYQRSLCIEFPVQELEFGREVWIEVKYKGSQVGRKRVDFFVQGVMVEIKAKSALEDVDFVQALSYLKASGCRIGLLLNFGAKTLEIRRLING